jgi:hypothetical protein
VATRAQRRGSGGTSPTAATAAKLQLLLELPFVQLQLPLDEHLLLLQQRLHARLLVEYRPAITRPSPEPFL